jgi:signal transduction histidine kinase
MGGLLSLLLGIHVYLRGGRDSVTGTFCLALLCCSVWCLGFFFFLIATNYSNAFFWRTAMDQGAIFIPVFWFDFVNRFAESVTRLLEKYIYYVLALGISLLNITNYFFDGIFTNGLSSKYFFHYYPNASYGYSIFLIFYLILVFRSLYLLYINYKHNSLDQKNVQIRFLILSTVFGFFGGGTTFLMTFNLPFAPWGIIIFLVYPFFIAYLIAKYKLFDAKLFYEHFLIVLISLILFTRIAITKETSENLINLSMFLVITLIGFSLYRRSCESIKQLEQITVLSRDLENRNDALTDLNQNLAQKVEAQTKEIRKAYEVEKRAKEEIERLDQNKSDFIIITQHHLRTPLSQIRWYLDSIASGLYGQISNEVSSAIENTTKITDKLYKILNHFLDISRLKVGHNILNIETVNLKNIIDSAIYEFRSDIKKKMISVKFVSDSWPEVSCDPEKIKDVFMVVLDNSIKYNKEGGEVYIGYAKSKKGYVVNFSNTGVALSKADLVSIFKDSFYRSSEAKKMNPTGMGVSLLVAKTIMLAHKGSIHLGLNKEGRTEVTLEFKR